MKTKLPMIFKIITGLIVLSFFLLIFNLKEIREQRKIIEDEHGVKTKLIGRQIDSFKELFGDSIYYANKKYSILIFSGLDCLSCIDRGIRIIKKISAKTDRYVLLIKSCPEVNSSIEEINYRGSIYIDNKDILRAELGLFRTPVIIDLDTLKRISDIYFLSVVQ